MNKTMTKDKDKLSNRQKDFVRYYSDTGCPETLNNATQAAIMAGYSSKGAHVRGHELLSNSKIIDAIKAHKTKTARKIDHNRTIAIELLHEAIAMARTSNDSKALIAAVRELDAISSLHSQTINSSDGLKINISKAETDIEDDAPGPRIKRIG